MRTKLRGGVSFFPAVESYDIYISPNTPIYTYTSKLGKLVNKEKVIEKMGEIFGTYKTLIKSRNGSINYFKKANLYISWHYDAIYCVSYKEDVLENAKKIILDFKGRSDKHVLMLSSSLGGTSLVTAGKINSKLIEENYSEECVKGIKEVVNWADSPNPRGRVTILSGPTGTGKSYAIRAMITESENEWAIVPPSVFPSLGNPDLIEVLISERSTDKPLIMVIEDADSLIGSKHQQDRNLRSAILNIGDGILGELADVRIIFSTNEKKADMDDAVIRSGRLFRAIRFEKLEPSRANMIYKRLCGKEGRYTSTVSLADVYAHANEEKRQTLEPKSEGGQYL